MLVIFLILILNVNGELLNYKISIKTPNKFDENYIVLSKNAASENIYLFDDESMCSITLSGRNIVAYTQKFTTFEKSSSNNFEISKHPNQIRIINCFKYNGYSYIIYKNKETDETVIIKGKNNFKIFETLKYDDIKFDYLTKKLYLINDFIIYNFYMEDFESFWETNTSYGAVRIDWASNLDFKITDLIIIDDHIFAIKDGGIFKKKIHDKNYEYVTATNSEKFNYIFYKSKSVTKSSETSNFYLLVLYGMEILIIFIAVYILNCTKLIKKKKEQFPILMEVIDEKRKEIY